MTCQNVRNHSVPFPEAVKEVIGTTAESTALQWMYQTMPVSNFSHDLLQQVPDHIVVMPLEGIVWNDWGTPRRITQTLQRMGKTPAFPLSMISGEGLTAFSQGATLYHMVP